MREVIQISRKEFYIIVGLCAGIIFLNSLDALIRVKDLDMFDMWIKGSNITTELIGKTSDEMYYTYLTMNLSKFFVRVITPIGLALHTYYALMKTGVNKSYVLIWSLLLVGSVLFSLLGESFITIFLVATVLLYIGLIIVMVTISKQLKNAQLL